MKQKGFTPIIILVIILIVVGVAFVLGQSLKTTPATTSPPTPVTMVEDSMADWKTYTSTKNHYLVKYPPDWVVHSIDPGIGEVPLNPSSKGFYVFPSEYKDQGLGNAHNYFVIETDSSANLAMPTYEKYLESVEKPYFPVNSVKEESFVGRKATIVEGDWDGYGFQAHIKMINFPSTDRKTYYSITVLTSNDSGYVSELDQILSTFKLTESLGYPTLISSTDSTDTYFQGEISPSVPYGGLKFKEIDVHGFTSLNAQLDSSDYQEGDKVYDGYTFVANKGEDFEFLAEEDRSSNPGSFINTELYGWGPTVIKMDTRIGWGVPATTRYFYVVAGKDHYGPNFVVPDASGRTFDGSKYGKYMLKITQRN